MSTRQKELERRLERGAERLQRLRDELRGGVDGAGPEAQEAWRRLEPEAELALVRAVVVDPDTCMLLEAVVARFERFGSRFHLQPPGAALES